MDQFSRILVRATNWVGDAVMSIPALAAIRERFPQAHITILARPGVADLYQGAAFCDQVLLYKPKAGFGDWGAKWKLSRILKGIGFDLAVILPNSLDSALVPFLAGIPKRIGFARDGRSLLLTDAVTPRHSGAHERFYYLELLRGAGILDRIPAEARIALHVDAAPRDTPLIGVSPGAANGTAKLWLPESFATAAIDLARRWQAEVIVFGTKDEVNVCERVASLIAGQGIAARSLAGRTTLREFMEQSAACKVFLTNDNGAMHIVSALGVPTVAIFGSTRHDTTGPSGDRAVVVREKVDCSPYTNPCMKFVCPIDHRCMTAVTPQRVAQEALKIIG